MFRPRQAAEAVSCPRVASGCSIQPKTQVCKNDEPEKKRWRLMKPHCRATADAVAPTGVEGWRRAQLRWWLREAPGWMVCYTQTARNLPPFLPVPPYLDGYGAESSTPGASQSLRPATPFPLSRLFVAGLIAYASVDVVRCERIPPGSNRRTAVPPLLPLLGCLPLATPGESPPSQTRDGLLQAGPLRKYVPFPRGGGESGEWIRADTTPGPTWPDPLLHPAPHAT